jgi:hypothetical protein
VQQEVVVEEVNIIILAFLYIMVDLMAECQEWDIPLQEQQVVPVQVLSPVMEVVAAIAPWEAQGVLEVQEDTVLRVLLVTQAQLVLQVHPQHITV